MLECSLLTDGKFLFLHSSHFTQTSLWLNRKSRILGGFVLKTYTYFQSLSRCGCSESKNELTGCGTAGPRATPEKSRSSATSCKVHIGRGVSVPILFYFLWDLKSSFPTGSKIGIRHSDIFVYRVLCLVFILTHHVSY